MPFMSLVPCLLTLFSQLSHTGCHSKVKTGQRIQRHRYSPTPATPRNRRSFDYSVACAFYYRNPSTSTQPPSSSSRTGGSCKAKAKAKNRASSYSNNLCQASRSTTSSASHSSVPRPKPNYQSIQYAISQDPNTFILPCARERSQNIYTFETTTALAQPVSPRATASATGYTACQGANAPSRHISTTDTKPNSVYPPKPCNQYSCQSNQSSGSGSSTQPKRVYCCCRRRCRTLCNTCAATAA